MAAREQYAQGVTYAEIMAWTGASYSAVRDAISGEHWKHLPLIPLVKNPRAQKRADNTSGFKGVRAFGTRWAAYVYEHGKQRHLGMFATAEEAARAHDAASIELRGSAARLNFT